MRRHTLLATIVGLLMLTLAARGAESATVTAQAGLNLRECPSLACQIYTVMPYTGWADVVAGPDANGWYQVYYGGTLGWAFGGWLAYDSGPEAPLPAADPQWAQGNEPVAASGGGVSSITGGAYGGGVIDAIYYWAGQYGVSADWLMAVAACESGFDPNAVGPNGEIGVFQFMPDTFYAHGGSNPWDPWDNARVAAQMFSQGLSWHWLCA